MEQARLRSRIEEVTKRPAPAAVPVFTDTADQKILKPVFHEECSIRLGLLRIRCYRDPEKETREFYESVDDILADLRPAVGALVSGRPEDESGADR